MCVRSSGKAIVPRAMQKCIHRCNSSIRQRYCDIILVREGLSATNRIVWNANGNEKMNFSLCRAEAGVSPNKKLTEDNDGMHEGAGHQIEYSLLPCIIGVTMALRDVPIHWGMAATTLIHFFATCLHFTAPESARSPPGLKHGLMPIVTLIASMASLFAMFLFGGKRLGLLCCANALCLLFYNGSPLMSDVFPIMYYSAVGDVFLLLTAGIIPMYGSYYAQELTFAINPLLSFSFSLGLIAVASNHAFNVGNISKHKEGGFKTLASYLTPQQAVQFYKSLVSMSAMWVAFVCAQWFSSILGLLPFVAFIFLWRLGIKFEVSVLKRNGKERRPNPEAVRGITDPISTAIGIGSKTKQCYSLIGILFVLSLALA